MVMTIFKDTFSTVTSLETLMIAHRHALKGKRLNYYATDFNYNLMGRLIGLQVELRNNIYQPYPYRRKMITDPKLRLIEAPAYRDRIVHHAIHYYLCPFYEQFFIRDSYACRPGRGIHSAVARIQHFLRASEPNLYVCQLDISKYYASINHDKLLELLQTKINDQQIINLLKIIINSTDSGHEHDSLFAPDSHYFTKGRRGIPIGNLTSQLFANVYLHEADMYAKQTLKIRHYTRYMDDILIFHKSKEQLRIWQEAMMKFLYEKLYLTINPHKVRVYPAIQGVPYVGYVIYPHYLRMRSGSVRRFKKRYRGQLRAMIAGQLEPEVIAKSFASWEAHASHANSKHLVKKYKLWQYACLFKMNYYHQPYQLMLPSPTRLLLLEMSSRLRQLSLFEDL
jgi:retron-type reverse transcriptase